MGMEEEKKEEEGMYEMNWRKEEVKRNKGDGGRK